MADTITNAPPKGKGTIGGIKKEYAYAGGAVVIIVIGVVYFRSKQQSSSASSSTSGTVTDPAGNVCAALDANSGYCPGSPEDLAYQGTGSNLVGQNSASYVGGQIIGYDQYGNPIYSSSSNQTGVPGGFTNNAQWAQAAQQYLVDNEPNANPTTIGAALGAYINGQPVTSDQRSIVEQAIAFEGLPPVGGANGNPPGIVDASGNTGGGGTGSGTGGGNATNPVTGLHVVANFTNLQIDWHASPKATSYEVTVTQAGRQITKQKTTGTSLSVGHLKEGTRYSVRVWAQPDPKKGTPASTTVTTKKSGSVNPGGKNVPPPR